MDKMTIRRSQEHQTSKESCALLPAHQERGIKTLGVVRRREQCEELLKGG